MKLKDLKRGDFFRRVNKNGKVGKKTFTKGEYCRAERKYYAEDCDDISNAPLLSGNVEVTTEFIY